MPLQRAREHPRAVLAVWRRALWHNGRELARAAAALYHQGAYATAGFLALGALEEVARSVIVLEAELEHRTRRPTAPTLEEVRRRTAGRPGRRLEAIIASFFLNGGAPGGLPADPSQRWERGQRLRRGRRSLLAVGLTRGLALPHQRCTAQDAYALVCVAYEALAEQAAHCTDEHPPTGLGARLRDAVVRELLAFTGAGVRTGAGDGQG